MAQVSSDSSFWSEKWFSSFSVMPVRVNSVDSLDPVQLSFSLLGWKGKEQPAGGCTVCVIIKVFPGLFPLQLAPLIKNKINK